MGFYKVSDMSEADRVEYLMNLYNGDTDSVNRWYWVQGLEKAVAESINENRLNDDFTFTSDDMSGTWEIRKSDDSVVIFATPDYEEKDIMPIAIYTGDNVDSGELPDMDFTHDFPMSKDIDKMLVAYLDIIKGILLSVNC